MCMKKMINLIVTASLILLSGCTKQEVRTIENGTFTTSSTGYQSEIEVEVTFLEGVITQVEVTQEDETKTWAAEALSKIPERIVNEQSVNVDVSSGATETSKAIMDAVKSAIEKAGGNSEEWDTDTTSTYETNEEEKETDVVIVGGGVSGITTALRLRQADIDCVIVEEDEVLGGALRYGGHYSQIVASSSEIEKKEEEAEINDPSELIADIAAYSDETADSSILQIVGENLGETVDWQINDLGIVFAEDWLETSSYQKLAVKEYDESNGAVGELLEKEAEVSGAEILTNTIMMNLETDETGVCGIKAKSSDGTIYHIQAKTVVIATGASFQTDALTVGKSSEILKIIGQSSEDTSNLYTNLAFAIDEENALDTFNANQEALKSGLIIVNKEGDRFVNEEISRNDLSDACCEDSYLLMNEKAYSKWKDALAESGQLMQEMEESFDDLVNHGKDLEEAAATAGIPYEELLETVNLFNAEVRNDASDIYLRKELGEEIDPEKDVYIVPLTKAAYASNDGLEVDASLHCNNMENVYVVGSAIGNAFGIKQAEGFTNAWAFVSAKYVADRIMEEKNA